MTISEGMFRDRIYKVTRIDVLYSTMLDFFCSFKEEQASAVCLFKESISISYGLYHVLPEHSKIMFCRESGNRANNHLCFIPYFLIFIDHTTVEVD